MLGTVLAGCGYPKDMSVILLNATPLPGQAAQIEYVTSRSYGTSPAPNSDMEFAIVRVASMKVFPFFKMLDSSYKLTKGYRRNELAPWYEVPHEACITGHGFCLKVNQNAESLIFLICDLELAPEWRLFMPENAHQLATVPRGGDFANRIVLTIPPILDLPLAPPEMVSAVLPSDLRDTTAPAGR